MANLWDNAACMEINRHLAARKIRHSSPTLGTTLGSPPGGHGHTTGSNHYPEWWGGPKGSTGQALDHGTYGSDCNAIALELERYAQGPNYVIVELIWTQSMGFLGLFPKGIYWKRGVRFKPSWTLARQHSDHVHDAIGVGRHLPLSVPSSGGFLMALSDADQVQLLGLVKTMKEWVQPDGVHVQTHIVKPLQANIDANELRLIDVVNRLEAIETKLGI